jgi:hypothetical protein
VSDTESDTQKDPLQAFFHARDQVVDPDTQPFEGGEHLWVGNKGAALATASLGVADFGTFKRTRAKEALTYGEIVAFSGDFYESPGDLFHEKPSPLPWLYESNDLDDLREALGHETNWIHLPPDERGTAYPDRNIELWWNAKQYTELALRNNSHFGWHNALEYIRWHEEALQLAAKASREPDSDKKDLLWREAVYTNGFADHFLTDGFAAGHVRTPAAQIRRWAKDTGKNEKLAGALIKVIHDQDGHVDQLHGSADHQQLAEGLRVLNARGDEWHTYCDGQLFVTGTTDKAVERAVEAVAESVKELLLSYQGKPLPEGVFAATRLIPWPHPGEEALTTKFPATLDDSTAGELFESIRWYVKLPWISAGIRPEHIQECFKALPGLVAGFRAEVAEQAARLPNIARRLPPEYIQGYRDLR